MCGLVGVAGDINQKYDKVFSQLLVVDIIRGVHSTGVFARTGSGDETVVKKALDAVDFLDLGKVDDIFKKWNKVLMGHNRHATVGNVNHSNAHPFEFDTLVGCHNGTLTNKKDLVDAKDFIVDSENLYHSIEKVGLEETVSTIEGAWALTWWDRKDLTLNFLRNDERPLHFCYSLNRKTLFWASEKQQLAWILDRNNVEHTDIVSLKVHHHMKFTIPKVGEVFNIEDVVTKDLTHLVKKPAPVGYLGWQGKAEVNAPLVQASEGSAYFRNEEITVVFQGTNKNSYKQEFINAYDVDNPQQKVRIFTKVIPKAIKKTLKAGTLIKGDLLSGKISRDAGGYLSLFPHSVKELLMTEEEYNCDGTTQEDTLVDTVEGFNGKLLDKEEFDKATARGCSWCSDHAEFGDDVEFISNHEFICESCNRDLEQHHIINGFNLN